MRTRQNDSNHIYILELRPKRLFFGSPRCTSLGLGARQQVRHDSMVQQTVCSGVWMLSMTASLSNELSLTGDCANAIRLNNRVDNNAQSNQTRILRCNKKRVGI
jgi:hypothetical protein